MNKLINTLKSEKEDFEFYPTTNEIISHLIRDIYLIKDKYLYSNKFNFSSFLDIGAGNGKVLKKIKDTFKVDIFAIEKSKTLVNLLNINSYIVGTDFNEQSIIDKKIDITFCNPPYSEFENWTNKILRESCSKYVYMVIPERWKDKNSISDSIKYRNSKFEVIGDYDFYESEDRKARARVQLIRFDLSGNIDEAFEKYFNEEFKDLKDKFSEKVIEVEGINENKMKSLIVGKDYVHSLVELYNNELSTIKDNYLSLKNIDSSILIELGINPNKILELLKTRLSSLKSLYWKEVISKMDKITNKLTSEKRQSLIDTLNKNGFVDFTESNVYSVILWILKNASNYIDEQLIDVYEDMISKANCKNYKSNEKVFKFDRWRYTDEKPTHFFLDYRIILTNFHSSISKEWSGVYKISARACEFIQNLLTVSNTLGFNCKTIDSRLDCWQSKDWLPGKPQIFEYTEKGKCKKLFEVKLHLNGNIHLRLSQDLALALNVEFGRLKGWLHNKEESIVELYNVKAGEFFRENKLFLQSPFLAIENKKEHKKRKVINGKVFERIPDAPALWKVNGEKERYNTMELEELKKENINTYNIKKDFNAMIKKIKSFKQNLTLILDCIEFPKCPETYILKQYIKALNGKTFINNNHLHIELERV